MHGLGSIAFVSAGLSSHSLQIEQLFLFGMVLCHIELSFLVIIMISRNNLSLGKSVLLVALLQHSIDVDWSSFWEALTLAGGRQRWTQTYEVSSAKLRCVDGGALRLHDDTRNLAEKLFKISGLKFCYIAWPASASFG